MAQFSLQVRASAASNRSCGECTLCCKALAITQLGKATGVACVHMLPGKCAVFGDRVDNPAYEDCNTYFCLWLQGNFKDGDRPDKIKCVFTIVPHPDKTSPRPLVVVNEAFPGAADGRRPREIIKDFVAAGYCVVVKNPQYSTEYFLNGNVIRYRIDQKDPLLMKYDVTAKPVVLTVGGRLI